MQALKELAVITALNDMMKKGRFDICCIREVSVLLGVSPHGSEEYKILSPLHMIYFAEMPLALRDAIPGMVEKMLGVAPTYRFKTPEVAKVIDVTPTYVAPSPVQDVPVKKNVWKMLGMS